MVIFASLIFAIGVVSFSSYPILDYRSLRTERSQSPHDSREGYSQDLDLMIKMEVGVMTLLLKNAGFDVDIATTSGYPIIGPTQKIEKLMRLTEINLDNYVGIIMP